MVNKILILFIMLFCLVALDAHGAKFYPYPQDCSLTYDTDGNGLWGTADTANCTGTPLASPDAFSAATGGFAAYFKDGQVAGTMAKVADANAEGGYYVGIPSGKSFTSGQGKVCYTFGSGDVTTGAESYKVYLNYIAYDNTSNVVWLQWDTPFKATPASNKAVILPVNTSYGFSNNAPVYITSSLPNRTNGTTVFSFTVPSAGQKCLYYTAQPSVRLLSVYISKETSYNSYGSNSTCCLRSSGLYS